MLFLIDDRFSGGDDFFFIRIKLLRQFAWEKIEITFSLHLSGRRRAKVFRVRRIVQHKPPLFVFRINVVRQIVYNRVQQIPFLRQLLAFCRNVAAPKHCAHRRCQGQQTNGQRTDYCQ